MSDMKHSVESEGAKPRDHAKVRKLDYAENGGSGRPFWKHAHRDWRVWVAAILMLVAIAVYVMTDSLSLRPGKRAVQPTPEISAP